MTLSENSQIPLSQLNVRVDCLHQLFEIQADTHAQNPAIIYHSQVLSYSQVEARANQLAWWLRKQGVVCGSRVGLLLPRSPQLYIAILAILKAGGAYVPLDPEYPADRIDYILADCGIQTIVTTAELADKKQIEIANIVCVDACEAQLDLESPLRLDRLVQVGARDLSYVIYTSGSTGRPKGVEIEHRSSCNYIQVVNETVYHVTPRDRVYQGFSIAFDASVEEVWCTFAAGAALVVGSIEQVRSGVDLAHFLTEQKVTVLSCVPTLLAMMEIEVPTIRLLILGGEQCPQELASRWCNDSRRVVNTYGPTEATVVTTWHECHPDRVITIGKPLPTYQVYILHEDLEPVADGVEGEIHIGGICLARGYVNRPDLTAEKFIPNPFTFDPESSDRLYKTGDIGVWTPEGEIQFLGRIDGQVKLRGFRIELSEIESVIMQCAGVSAAVVAVKQVVEIDRLIAYIVPKQGAELDFTEIWDNVRSRLPIYMVPASLEIVATLPTLPSGKVDRKNLPAPQNFGANIPGKTTGRLATTQVERDIATVWETVFGMTEISIDDEFFNQLGGHSLLAAVMVSKLRQNPQFQDLAVLDVYQHPTIAQLAAELTNRWHQRNLEQQTSPAKDTPPPIRHISTTTKIAGAMWASIGVYLIYILYSLPLLIPGFVYYELVDANNLDLSRVVAGEIAAALIICTYPALILLSIPIKWLVIGRFKPGHYPLWSLYYWRFWLVRQVVSFVPLMLLTGSPLFNWYCRLMGAKIGKDVYLGTTDILAFDLLSVGDGSSIGTDSNLMGCEVIDGWLKIDRITVGKDCCVGTKSVLGLNTHLEDDAELGDLSYLPDDRTIPQGEVWVGAPARYQTLASATKGLFPFGQAKRGIPALLYLGYAIGTIAQLLVPAIAALPGFLLWCKLIATAHWYLWLIPSAFIGSASFIGVFCLEVVILKYLLLGKVRPGVYPLHSSFGLRHWYIDRLMSISLEMVPTLYSTLYLLPWLRLLGAKIGARAEVSTASHFTPDLLSIGAESFIADNVSIGASQVKRGWLQLSYTHIGSQAFVGNSALVPIHTNIADNCLIGCMSVPPIDRNLMVPDSAWMGSPAIYIPHRQIVDEFSAAQTYKPRRRVYLQRLAIEFCRVTFPGTIHFVVLLMMEVTMLNLPDICHWSIVALIFPVIYASASIGSALLVIALKWLVVGRYQPATIPLWSTFVWRTELITGLYESMVVSGCLNFLLGTPFAAIILRLLGVKIGKNAYIDTTDFTEFDLISIGNNVTLNHNCTLQTHLFEDRVMKMERIRLENDCQMGSAAVVLYDSLLANDVSIHPLSLIMKGEQIPESTSWQGIPASRVY